MSFSSSPLGTVLETAAILVVGFGGAMLGALILLRSCMGVLRFLGLW